MPSTAQDSHRFIWEAVVRGYELDAQGIVNNAHYFHYFDEARVSYLLSKGIDWNIWHKRGLDLVLIQSEIKYKASLTFGEQFQVISTLSRLGKLRLVFKQEIFRLCDNQLIATAINTTTCVCNRTKKPTMPEELLQALSLQ